jgi:hypothetical protein
MGGSAVPRIRRPKRAASLRHVIHKPHNAPAHVRNWHGRAENPGQFASVVDRPGRLFAIESENCMRRTGCFCAALFLLVAASSRAAALERSDVVFMYQADARTYSEYGATVVAWGGTPRPETLEAAKGLRFFGSVGMVTEFSRYYDRFPTNYTEGLCRDIDGQPVKVPWLTDHQHRRIPYWWCCSQQPIFRQYLRERVEETMKAGAHGLHIDDHLGTAGGLWLGICFCDRCVEGFKAHLKSLPPQRIKELGVEEPAAFNFREQVRQWIKADKTGNRKPQQHPLWPEWTVWQYRAAASFMEELHALANQIAQRHVPMGANAGLLWAGHLSDYKALDLFSAETDHHASARRFSDLPVFAYRLAEAVDRPYAATASGGDWAFVKENNSHRLVQGWIALAYASGQLFMAPHRQWCYTPEKGTHWYTGPTDVYAPLYRFVREHADIFDGHETVSDIAVVLPHRAYMRTPNQCQELCAKLAAANLSFRILLAGDDIVDLRLRAEDISREKVLLVVDRSALLDTDRKLLEAHSKDRVVVTDVDHAISATQPAVRVQSPAPVRILPRARAGEAVVHVLNYDYDAASDTVRELSSVRLKIDQVKLGISPQCTVSWVPFGGREQQLKIEDGHVVLPKLNLWGILVLKSRI